MLKWYNDCFVQNSMKKSFEKIKGEINAGTCKSTVNLIVVSLNKEDVFDILNMKELKYEGKQAEEGYDGNIYVVGIAKSRDDAKELAGSIISSYYTQRGTLDVRSFFEDKKNEFN